MPGVHGPADEPRAFDLAEAVAVLERTPRLLRALLRGLPEAWLHVNEGAGTWSPFDVVAHLVHGERTDWIVRARVILEHGDARPFEPFDRRGHERWWDGWTMGGLLDELARRRAENLDTLRGLGLDEDALDRPGAHPELGPVTLRQLVAAWVVHDLHHVGQVTRVLAKRYADEVGPWSAYLGVLGQ